jgi:hypothetical protein
MDQIQKGLEEEPHKKTSSFSRQSYGTIDCSDKISEVQTELLIARLNAALQLPFDVDQATLDHVNEIYAPRIILPRLDDGGGSVDTLVAHNAHPIAAVGSLLCSEYLSQLEPDIEFGPSMRSTMKENGIHYCLKMSGRDDARVVTAAIESKQTTTGLVNFLSEKSCVHGAENCHYPATLAIGNQVAYDIDLHKDLPRIFHNHGLKAAYFSFIRLSSIFGRDGGNDKRHGLSYTRDGENITMSFIGDYSWSYTHNADNWYAWCNTNVIHCEGFSLAIERFKTFGPFVIARVTRITRGMTIVKNQDLNEPGCYPVLDLLDNLPAIQTILSANVVQHLYTNEKMLDVMRLCPVISVPIDVHSKATSWLFNRKDANIDRNHAGTMFSAQLYSIVVSGYDIQKGYVLSPEMFMRVVTAILIQSFVTRLYSSKAISAVANKVLKQSEERLGFLQEIKLLINSITGFARLKFKNVLKETNLSAEMAGLSNFASIVMGDTKRHEVVRRCILRGRPVDSEIITETVPDNTNNHIYMPTVKEFTFDPNTEGYCYQQCFAKLTGIGCCLEKNPTVNEIRDFEKEHVEITGAILEEPKIDIVAKRNCYHAVVKTDTSHICEHVNFFQTNGYLSKNVNVLKVVYEDRDKDYILENVEFNSNRKKNKWVLDHIAADATITDTCAYPYNAYQAFADRKNVRSVFWHHNIIGEERHRFIPPNLAENHTVLFNKNLLCQECVQTIDTDVIYVDFGCDANNTNLAAMQYRILNNLITFHHDKQIFVKLQRFNEISESERNLELLFELRQHWRVFRNADSFCSGEVMATYNVKSGDKRVIFHPKRPHCNVVPVMRKASSIEVQQVDDIVKIAKEENERKKSKRLYDVIYEHISAVEEGRKGFVETPFIVIEKFVPSLVPTAPEADLDKVLPSAPPLDEVVEPVSKTGQNNENPNIASGGVILNQKSQLADMDTFVQVHASVDDGQTCELQENEEKGVSDIKSDYFVGAKHYKVTAYPLFTGFKRFGHFVGPIEDASEHYFETKRHKNGNLKHKNNVERFNATEERNTFYSSFHPESFGQYEGDGSDIVAYSDLEGVFAEYGIDAIVQAKVYLDFPQEEHFSEIPFYGKILGVEENGLLNAIPFEDPELAFTNIDVHFGNTSSAIAQFVKQMSNARDNGVFAKLHKTVADQTKEISSQIPEEVNLNFIEGTYCSGKTFFMKKSMVKAGHDKENSVVICPTASLAKEYENGRSWAAALKQINWQSGNGNLEAIYIDEIFCIDPRVLLIASAYCSNIFAIGDSRQMKGGGKNPRFGIPSLDEMLLTQKLNQEIQKNNVARSTPLDIVAFLNQTEPEKTYSLSLVCNSVEFCKIKTARTDLPNICDDKCEESHCHVYGAVFDDKAATSTHIPTVATIQGKRYSDFFLFVTCNAKLVISVHGQKLVGITRHTQKLTIYTPATANIENLFKIAPIVGSNICGAREDKHTIFGNNDLTGAEYVEAEKFSVRKEDVNLQAKGKGSMVRLRTILEQHEEYEQTATMGLPIEASVQNMVFAIPERDYDVPLADEVQDEIPEGFTDNNRMTIGTLNQSEIASFVQNKIAPTCSPIYDETYKYNILHHDKINPNRKVRISTSRPLVDDDPIFSNVKATPNYSIAQFNNANHQLATGIERYAKIKKMHIPKNQRENYLAQLVDGFSKFVDMNKLRGPNEYEYEACRAASVIRIAAKEHYPDPTLYGETFATTGKISCFNKQQQKSKIGENVHHSIKVGENGPYVKGGQMVSAQPKNINEIVAPYVNWAERSVIAALKPGVFLGYGVNARTLRNRVKRRYRKIRAEGRPDIFDVRSCDIDQQDTSKEETAAAFMRKLYNLCGVPDKIIDMMDAPNVDWIMDTATVKCRTKYQFQSGRRDTLLSNTFQTMAEIGKSFDFDYLRLALFQGDDAYLEGERIRETHFFFDRLKVDENKVGDFIGFLIANGDLYLDIPRISGKLLSKHEADNGRHEELRQATKDVINLHTSAEQHHANQHIAALKYGVSYGDIGILWEYLVAYASEKDGNLPTDQYRTPEWISATLVPYYFKGAQ